jgi:hydroxymethylpyrimidine/phosphomethylpyrimidine kinase
VFGTSAVTAVTVQNTQKVYDIQEMRPEIVLDQITCLFDDFSIHAVKIGMVASVALLRPGARAALVRHLFPLARVVTPNLPEAEALLGKQIADVDAMNAAAGDIAMLGKKVVVKGGHLGQGNATDVLFPGEAFKMLERRRIDTVNTHGTGCTFSSAIAAQMARIKHPAPAARRGRDR